MKHNTIFLSGIIALVACLFSCGKDNPAPDNNNNGNNNNGNNTATTLPVNCDFSVLQPKAAIQNVNGVNYTYTLNIPGSILNPDGTWKPCVPTGTDSFSTGSNFWHGTVIHGVLIGDVSKLPAINKVTIKAQISQANQGTQIRLCDGNGIVAESAQNNQADTITEVLNVGGKKAEKLYYYVGEATVFSVLIE
ncbi:hypothetical protein [Taibaiella koreensis]|uniref:hypothetical protein n=1 Tax=Taibaiella koreensis TaxID=1268548 RepID=UPI000E599140|nr:hypothetical protein [Taibaiella koreensis]